MTSDKLETLNDNMTNARIALAAYMAIPGMCDNHIEAASDLIADLLHLLNGLGGPHFEVTLGQAAAHFVNERAQARLAPRL